MSQAIEPETSAGEAAVGTVDDVTRQLLGWLNKTAPALHYAAAEVEPRDTPCMQVSLLRLSPGAASRNPLAPLELQLDYLCIVTDGNALVVQRALGDIVFAALESGVYGVSAPQSGPLGLILTARLVRSRSIARGPRVRSRLRPNLLRLSAFSGILLGPGKTAVPGASVRIAGQEETPSYAASGSDGRFKLLADAQPGQEIVLEVEINGRRHTARGVAGGTETAFLIAMEE